MHKLCINITIFYDTIHHQKNKIKLFASTLFSSQQRPRSKKQQISNYASSNDMPVYNGSAEVWRNLCINSFMALLG